MNTYIHIEEYQLENGLHIILQPNLQKPLITVGVMYKAGSKDDPEGKSGFAHFFEHLLFEGTKNIARGEWFNIVAEKGGSNNAFTTKDKTYYYETFPSHHLQLALYLESERMRHPIINDIGVQTQKQVVKEEKLQRITNAPYGKFIYGMSLSPYIFPNHPYGKSVIGKMSDIERANKDDFAQFYQKYYNPNNAVLVVAGSFDTKQAKGYIQAYFGIIENKSPVPERNYPKIEKISYQKITETDPNISLPLKAFSYQAAAVNSPDAPAFDLLNAILTAGKSARLEKVLVEQKQIALQVLSYNQALEEAGSMTIGGIPMGNVSLEEMADAIEKEIQLLITAPISNWELEKIQNQLETDVYNSYKSTQGIALALASYHCSFSRASIINEQMLRYKHIKPSDIQRVAACYLQKQHCIELDYLPQENP